MSFNCQKCKPHCQATCCSCFPWEVEHIQSLEEKAVRPFTLIPRPDLQGDKVIPDTATGQCPFLKDDYSCAVYNDRPKVCKMFGTGKGFDGGHDWRMVCEFQLPNGTITANFLRKKSGQEYP